MDSRRLILLLIFSFSVAMLWDAWQKYQNPSLRPAAVAAGSVSGGAAAGVPTPSAALQAAATPAVAAGVPAAGAAVSREVVTITTDLYKAEVAAQGGDLLRLELLTHKTHDQTGNFVLFDAAHQYAAQSGLIGNGLPNHKTVFKIADGPRELAAGSNSLQLRLDAPAAENGLAVSKVYTFRRGSYLVDVAWEISNGSPAAMTPHAYFQLQRDDVTPEGETKMVSTFTGPAVYTDAEKYQKVDFADIEKGKAKFTKTADNGWLAMVQHYFVAAWLPQGNIAREFYMKKPEAGSKAYSAGVIVPVASIAPGSKGGITMPLYAGPQEQSALKMLAPGFDLVVDYGWLTLIAAPIFWALQWIYALVGNWGWAIVVLTILIKLAFFPLSAASYKSMAKMRAITPRLTQLKERFSDDKQRLNQEMMKLYQTEKINPLGGCLPILVQIPVFIALYWVLLGAVEMRGAPWILWIRDLSSADPFYVLPVIMVVSMLIQTKLNPTPPDPVQAKVMMMMPFIFGVMFFFFPAGLVLYWVVNNVLSIAQQWQITRMIESGGDTAKNAANDAKA